MGKLIYLNPQKATKDQILKYLEWCGLNDYRLGRNENDFNLKFTERHRAWLSGYKRGPRDKKTKLQLSNVFRIK